jgi:hypothetical protein
MTQVISCQLLIAQICSQLLSPKCKLDPGFNAALLMRLSRHKSPSGKYRARLPGFELPEAIAVQQREFDDRLAESLDRMADGIEGRSTPVQQTLEDALAKLDRAIQVHRPTGVLVGRLQALLVLGRRIESSMVSLTNEIGTEQLGSLTLR